MKIKFEDELAQESFQNRFGTFISEIGSIRNTVENCEIIRNDDYKEELIYFLWRSIWDDFSEILLLYSNGYPLGALKILRGMFEKTVHIAYFLDHPEAIDLFLDFAWVDEKKMINHIPEFYSDEYKKTVNDEFNKIKEQFEIPVCNVCKVEDCRDCRKTRIGLSWLGKSNVVDIAIELEIPKELIRESYYVPLQETHPKPQSLSKRLVINDGGFFEYKHDWESNKSDLPLYSAHFLLISSFEAFIRFCNFSHANEVTERLFRGFKEVWHKNKNSKREANS